MSIDKYSQWKTIRDMYIMNPELFDNPVKIIAEENLEMFKMLKHILKVCEVNPCGHDAVVFHLTPILKKKIKPILKDIAKNKFGGGNKMNILVTGGMGYIGSHIAKTLKESGHNVYIIDNLSNSKKNNEFNSRFYYGDIRNINTLIRLFSETKFDLVIHCAALKSVEESIKYPLEYYDNNVSGTLTLLTVMKEYGVNKIIFSSTAGVYEEGIADENHPINPKTPYSKSKKMAEDIIIDSGIDYVIFRYFNVAGDDVEGQSLIQTIKNNSKIVINGGNYNTFDGTPVRDYIHVDDIVDAHIKAINYDKSGIFNLGSNKGYSVKQVCEAAKIPYTIGCKRPGDIEISIADSSKAKEKLEWIPNKTLEDMLK